MVSGKRLFHTITFGEQLIKARVRLNLSQEALAEAIGTTARSISRWEHDQAIPQQYYRERLCEVLQTTPEELFRTSEDRQQVSPQAAPLWHVPYARNPYFVGRETLLRQLHERLNAKHKALSTQLPMLSGLGGIGKTQTALEYIYRFRNEYQAVLWVGAETYETFMADYLHLAHLFDLPEKDHTNQILLREAVKRWFQNHTNWLLVFDNVEDLELLHKMLPNTNQGHILITTRSQITGTLGLHINLQQMERAEGALFLLQRAKLLHPDEPLEAASTSMRKQAETLVDLLDGLPLALDQAGAYIEETACSLSDYLERYAARQNILLDTRGYTYNHHPASVTATLSLSFQQVVKASPIATDLLRVCAFLYAEAIPEEFLTRFGESLGPILQPLSANPLLLDTAIRELRRFSLIHREAETKTLNIHRLLQSIIKDGMDKNECRQWIDRIIEVMLQIFPDYRNPELYGIGEQTYCQQYLPHALKCAAALKEWDVVTLAAGEFLYRLGCYLQFLGDFAKAEQFLLQAPSIVEKMLGINDVLVMTYLDELAYLYLHMKKYIQAERYYRQTLAIREKTHEADHPEIAESLWGLANVLRYRGLYNEVESLAKRALVINEQAFGPHHYKVGLVLSTLGINALIQGKYSKAKDQLQRTRDIYKKLLGSDHFYVAYSLKHLAYAYQFQRDYTEATALYHEALQIYEKNLTSNHNIIANILHRLGNTYFAQRDYKRAEDFYKKALGIFSQLANPHPFYTTSLLVDLGDLYLTQGHLQLASDTLLCVLPILGKESPVDRANYQEIIHCLFLVGEHLASQNEPIEAQFSYQRALALGEQMLGLDHPLTVQCRSSLEQTFASIS